ncbi:MAG: 30S ribosomal protein S17 [Bdellovibrionota bacterium]|nr:MAG: 30S ribosomal protein S17 [Pseudomonadota bacterium]
MSEVKEKKSKPFSGLVTSDKMDKSRVVTVERLVKHEQYGKYIKRRTKIMFHDEKNESRIGDTVLVIPSRPHSARKRFDLLKIVDKAADAVD